MRRSLSLSLAVRALVTVIAVTGPANAQTAGVPLTGRLTVLETANRSADDVGHAVVWLDMRRRIPVRPDTVDILTSDKEFRPRVVVVPTGSYVRFPNNDPFNHNVFSRSDAAVFDLGLFGRGEVRGKAMTRPGVVNVYCNVHARMSGFVVVRDNPFFAQPSADGSFIIAGVPPGRYTLHAWHERAKEPVTQDVTVGPQGLSGVRVQLDARGYEWEPHLDKFGKPYEQRGRRY